VVALADDSLHDNVGYTPFAGRTLRGWPVTVLRRGEVVISGGKLHAAPGSGRRQPMALAPAMRPTGTPSPEFDPATNFGARLQ
jgi:dihydropyrimidinase